MMIVSSLGIPQARLVTALTRSTIQPRPPFVRLGFIYLTIYNPTNKRAVQKATISIQVLSRKEVFQPHLPVRLPCSDLAPITSFTLGRSLRSRTSGTPGFHGLTCGVYKARERIDRAVADARLLANPASWSRVADSSPN